eukprot:CAMPEP_0119367504 /NCGR_PEP_ID=MMETSP1334-20130426/14290_1 /TAXON_ID=127549 /ORGANISM="Calcidiscus leptoporus, Strain RCC1130" /LENGTH=42 /DNA_ID= /DNA_START= /DNA_END= /DNA_ORIENTATION=
MSAETNRPPHGKLGSALRRCAELICTIRRASAAAPAAHNRRP